jgi:hypothetical protein
MGLGGVALNPTERRASLAALLILGRLLVRPHASADGSERRFPDRRVCSWIFVSSRLEDAEIRSAATAARSARSFFAPGLACRLASMVLLKLDARTKGSAIGSRVASDDGE